MNTQNKNTTKTNLIAYSLIIINCLLAYSCWGNSTLNIMFVIFFLCNGLLLNPKIQIEFCTKYNLNCNTKILNILGLIITIIITTQIKSQLNNQISEPTQTITNANAPKNIDYKKRIPEYTVEPYTKEQDPDVFIKYKKQISRINTLRKTGAKAAIDSGKCDTVNASEINFERSKKDNIVIFIDCDNKNRIYISENDIKFKEPLNTEKEKAWNEQDAMNACISNIKANSNNPETVDIHSWGGVEHFTAETSGNVVVNMEFEAKNDFNMSITYIAHCVFPPNSLGEMTVTRK